MTRPRCDWADLDVRTARYAEQDAIIASGLAPIGASLGVPKFPLRYELVAQVRLLAPLRSWWDDGPEVMRERYLHRLDEIGVGRIGSAIEGCMHRYPGAVLLCFEGPGQPCHRHWFAEWWEAETGVEVPDLAHPPARPEPVAAEQLRLI